MAKEAELEEEAEEVDERLSDTHNSLLLYSSSIMVCILFWRSCFFIDLDCTIFSIFIGILFLYGIFGPSEIMYIYFFIFDCMIYFKSSSEKR